MNRRGFLKFLGGAAATATSYFFAPAGGWTKPDQIWTATWECEMPASDVDQLRPIAFLRGIPYYITPGTSREYLGVKRGAMGLMEMPEPLQPHDGWRYLLDPANQDRLTYRGIKRFSS